MDKDTNDKLNDTLGKMGVMGATQPHGSAGSKAVKSSDKGFYLFMLVLVIVMALYISYDMDKRYGSEYGSQAVGVEPAAQSSNQEPVIVSVEKQKTITLKPVAEIPATDDTPETLMIQKKVNKTVVTTAAVPVEQTAPEASSANAADNKPPVVTGVVNEMAKQYKSVVDKGMNSASKMMSASLPEQSAAPVNAAETSVAPTEAQTTQTAGDTTSAPAYNAYGYPYGNPYQRNYYQPQPQYGNPYYNQNRYPYGYRPGYGRGYNYNPYQAPAVPPAE